MLVGALNHHISRQTSGANGTRDANGCLICTNLHPSCDCQFGQQCVLINRNCDQCPYMSCISSDDAKTSSGGVSKGSVAAAVVVTILVLAGTVAAYFWYRRRQRLLRQNTASEPEGKPDVPARAEDVLNRPDPNEKPNSPPPQLNNVRIYSGTIHGTINLDPAASYVGHSSGASVHSNPFEDNHSIQTTSTGTQSNVIPIALVPPGTVGSRTPSSESHDRPAPSTTSTGVNLDHVNVSNDSLNPHGPYTQANRMSYMTTGSYTSDFLETSVIVTPTRGTVKQVVGVAKAQVLSAPPSDTLSRSSTLSKPARSPLAASSFGPADVMQEADEEQEIAVSANPFSDTNSPYSRSQGSPAPSSTTFGTPEPSYPRDSRTISGADWLQEDPAIMYGSSDNERPASVYTQASAIVADISNARRVHLGFDQVPHMPQTPVSAALSTPRTPYRLTSAKLVSPLVNNSAAIQTGASSSAGALEVQQARALKELSAESGKRISMSSVMTAADSILESFPFVPPSPISNLPPRTPPRSPLAQQSFANAQEDHSQTQSARELVNRARASASSSSTLSVLAAPNRKLLGMSVASQSSTVSNGLGSFPFQIDSGAPPESATSTAPSAFSSSSDTSSQRKRASLDTLALTSDLSSYPLGFDKTPVPPVPRRP
ncbi:hypothetical protein C8Q80DRAFT_1222739 [Daedaleopsis nitida]|nr:hypothetical protein C8Q80DRAFT_1222739 [Daedaleopsis nitida]